MIAAVTAPAQYIMLRHWGGGGGCGGGGVGGGLWGSFYSGQTTADGILRFSQLVVLFILIKAG